MRDITSRQYRILADHMDIYAFMLSIYEKDWRNGVPAPFLEYALSSSWMDKSYVHRNRIWFHEDRIVGFCFYEAPVTDAYFSLRPGYEELAPEMIAYARDNMPNMDGKQRLVLFGGQSALMRAAADAGYAQVDGYYEKVYAFDAPLNHPLPDGYHFVHPAEVSVEKCAECCWKGFGHEEEEGAWSGDAEHGYYQLQAPHATPEFDVAIANAEGEYVCYAGMWWTPENRLAYMEPLCTVPAHRGRGLASAALSELYRRLQPLGATHMTGGGNPFYDKIGFKPMIQWTFWKMKG